MNHNENTAVLMAAVYLVFRKENQILLLLRANTGWSDGNYGLPGGRVDKGETFTIAGIREAAEEVGVEIEPQAMRMALAAQRHHADADWIDVFFEVGEWKQELYNAESDKHSEIRWVTLDSLPENMVPYLGTYLQALRDGKRYVEWSE